jgi:hypothetical protein
VTLAEGPAFGEGGGGADDGDDVVEEEVAYVNVEAVASALTHLIPLLNGRESPSDPNPHDQVPCRDHLLS